MHEALAPRQEARCEGVAGEEADLLRAARTDASAFAPLYERYFPRIYAYCLRRAGAAMAEDLSSQIFTRALANLRTYRGGSVGAWLFRIAHNTVVNYLRDRRIQAPLDPTMLDSC